VALDETTVMACGLTGCRSAAASALHRMPSKCLRSRARSGRLQRRVRRSGRRLSGCQPHAPATPARYHACITGLHLNHTQHTITHCTTRLQPNHTQHTIRLPIAGAQHNERSYHTRHNGQSAQRAFVPRPAPRAWARRSRHDGRSQIAPAIQIRREACRSRSPDAERLSSAARRMVPLDWDVVRAHLEAKMALIPAGWLQRVVRVR
jgi:hypothetical protein